MKIRKHLKLITIAFAGTVLTTASAQFNQMYTAWTNSISNWPSNEEKDAYADPDGDGDINLREYALGSNPLIVQSEHNVSITANGSSSNLTFLKRSLHPSAFLYLRLTRGSSVTAELIPTPINESIDPLDSNRKSVTVSVPAKVTAAEIMVLPAQVGLQEANNLKVSVGKDLKLSLSWEDRSPNETGYRVERRTYNVNGMLTGSAILADIPANSTSFKDPASHIEGFLSYSVTPLRVDTTGMPLEYGTPSDYTIVKYSSNNSIRDLDCDFVTDSEERTNLSDTQDPFSVMRFRGDLTLPLLWQTGSVNLLVSQTPAAGEFSSIAEAIASTSSTKL